VRWESNSRHVRATVMPPLSRCPHLFLPKNWTDREAIHMSIQDLVESHLPVSGDRLQNDISHSEITLGCPLPDP
jgi:hypothetical protein